MISFNRQQIDMVSVPKEAAEKLLSLPDGCARLYLYGLLRVGAELTQITAELEMSRQDVIRGLDELSAEDKLTVMRARKIQKFLSQPTHVAKAFTGQDGRFVKVEDTVEGFRKIVEGEADDVPENAFFMVGTYEEALEKAKTL